ncbi:hypothetical protein [Bacillus alkalicellulosilyticus]|uniref:hypothetical protein n=1 Tax=Alkalihalobacterium alkalicellulosilyticum TaxID=1912214 RepID=UPI0009978B64|nr:hypothetical protein [Bacillus alkalicellulosilyticus]
MKLLGAMIAAILVGSLIFLGPVGMYLLGAIVIGVLFRCYVLLVDIHKRLSSITKTPDKVEEAYENYMKAKQER